MADTPDDVAPEVESALRWRLVLGRWAEESLPVESAGSRGESAGARDLDAALSFVYDREFARRAHRKTSEGGGRGLTVPTWLRQVRALFPETAARIVTHDALVRFGLSELVTDPSVLRQAEPTEELVKAILQYQELLSPEVKSVARTVIRQVVDALAARLRRDVEPALRGRPDPRRAPVRSFRNTDWNRTIRRNLRHFDRERQQLVAERIAFRHRQAGHGKWRIVLLVDQSGSMLDSLLHSAVLGAIFASVPALVTNVVLFDHRCMDVSALARDPLELLLAVQLGGGTLMLPALQYGASLVTDPRHTILVVLSDFFVGAERKPVLALAHELHEAGVRCVGLCALDGASKPVHDEAFARELAGVGWTMGAMGPSDLAAFVGRVVR